MVNFEFERSFISIYLGGSGCVSGVVAATREFYEPEHTSRGPAKLTQLEPTSLEADRGALWAASEAAIGEKWEL